MSPPSTPSGQRDPSGKHPQPVRDVVLERKPSAELAVYENDPPEKFWLLISDLLKGPDTWMANSVLEAKQYADEVENLMPTLKGYIVGNTEIEQKSKTLAF